MRSPHNNLPNHRYSGVSDKHSRQYRLIHYVTWELAAAGTLIIALYAASKLWYLVLIIGSAIFFAMLNLWALKRFKNTLFCSHAVVLIVYLTVVSTNYLIWGISPLHSQWFYVMPLLAASLTGMSGLFVYSIASAIILIAYGLFSIPAYYQFTAYQFLIIEWVNDIFSYIIIVTTLASLLHENQRYEKEMKDKNHLLQAEKERYHYLAQVDQLTELPNRRYFTQYLHDIIESLEPSYCVTVFFIDLDNFKQVNDQYGHNIGDQLLLETSRRLKFCFREDDFIARLGGDEFTAVVLHTENKNIPQLIAQRIIREFERAFQFENGIENHYSISIGFSTYPADAKTASDLIIKADLAMYSAKKITGSSYFSAEDK